MTHDPDPHRATYHFRSGESASFHGSRVMAHRDDGSFRDVKPSVDRMAQHFEAMNDPDPNWPLLIGAACLCAAVVGGLTAGVALALGWW